MTAGFKYQRSSELWACLLSHLKYEYIAVEYCRSCFHIWPSPSARTYKLTGPRYVCLHPIQTNRQAWMSREIFKVDIFSIIQMYAWFCALDQPDENPGVLATCSGLSRCFDATKRELNSKSNPGVVLILLGHGPKKTVLALTMKSSRKPPSPHRVILRLHFIAPYYNRYNVHRGV